MTGAAARTDAIPQWLAWLVSIAASAAILAALFGFRWPVHAWIERLPLAVHILITSVVITTVRNAVVLPTARAAWERATSHRPARGREPALADREAAW